MIFNLVNTFKLNTLTKAITISFTNYKGGTGKTTTCINVAGYLAKTGKKVLVIDLDPQANSTAALGIDKSDLRYTVFDALLYKSRNNPKISIKKTILYTDFKNLFIVPSDLGLCEAEYSMQSAKNSSLILDRCLDEVRDLFDYILIDTSSGPSFLMINSLMSADKIIIPIDSSLYSLDALESIKIFYNKIKKGSKHNIDEFIIVFNRFKGRGFLKKFSDTLFNEPSFNQYLIDKVKIDFYIKESKDVVISQFNKTPISDLSYKPKVGKVYQSIANYIIEKSR